MEDYTNGRGSGGNGGRGVPVLLGKNEMGVIAAIIIPMTYFLGKRMGKFKTLRQVKKLTKS